MGTSYIEKVDFSAEGLMEDGRIKMEDRRGKRDEGPVQGHWKRYDEVALSLGQDIELRRDWPCTGLDYPLSQGDFWSARGRNPGSPSDDRAWGRAKGQPPEKIMVASFARISRRQTACRTVVA